jgi:hypothetical protein
VIFEFEVLMSKNRLAIPIYEKEELDTEARVFGTKLRATLQGSAPKRV